MWALPPAFQGSTSLAKKLRTAKALSGWAKNTETQLLRQTKTPSSLTAFFYALRFFHPAHKYLKQKYSCNRSGQ
jgi:hypothetical protein